MKSRNGSESNLNGDKGETTNGVHTNRSKGGHEYFIITNLVKIALGICSSMSLVPDFF